MGSHSVACSTAPFEGHAGCQSTSAPTTILFTSSTNGKPICGSWRWQKSRPFPYVPQSHPFVERLIGTIRREYLDHMLFWTSADLENKLLDFRTYFNHHRPHHSREGRTPDMPVSPPVAKLRSFRWQPHCRGLYQTRSDTYGRLSFQRCALPAICRSPRATTRNEIIRVGVLQFFIAARFVNLAVSLPQYQFASHRFSVRFGG